MDLGMHAGPGGCIARHLAKQRPPVTGYEYLKRPDGTFLIGFKGGNIHRNHWHVAPDATVLSVVENGDHRFKRTDVTRKIDKVCPDLNISFLWNG